MSYKVKGDDMVITHLTGTWEIELTEDGRLYQGDRQRYFALD